MEWWPKWKLGVQVPSPVFTSALAWPLPHELQFFPFLFPLTAAGGKKRNFNVWGKWGTSPAGRKRGRGKQPASLLPLSAAERPCRYHRGVVWQRSTATGPAAALGSCLLSCWHPDPALYPCFLRNNYLRTDLKSISWSREWPVWKLSDVSELRLCQ